MQRNKTLTVLSIILVGLLAASVFVLSNDSSPESDSGSATTSGEPPTVVRCAKCGTELPYAEKIEGKPCPNCREGILKGARRSLRDGPEPARPIWRSPMALGVLSLTAVLALANGVAWWVRFGPKRKKAVTYVYTRCPNCKRKVKTVYRVMQRTILCPTCRRELYLPPSGSATSKR
jgi:ribosomal protein S27E